MKQDLLTSIHQMYPKFSKGQRLIASYLTDHFDKAAFMTAAKLGQAVGISESTVVRFASEIGYAGYPELQHDLQEVARYKLTTIQRMDVTVEQLEHGDVLEKVLNRDMDRIRRTIEETKEDKTRQKAFDQAVDSICNAKSVYVIGVRSSAALAQFLSYYFHHIFENVKLINTTSRSEMFEQIMHIGPSDVIIVISFPRYSKRTAQASLFAHNNGAKVIALTDSDRSPIASAADYLLLARGDMISFVDSMVAPLSLINALIVAIGLKKRKEIAHTYEVLERIWDEYDVYEKREDSDA